MTARYLGRLLVVVFSAAAMPSAARAWQDTPIAPPVVAPTESFFEKFRENDREAARAFYKKVVDVKGLTVAASGDVADEALRRVHEIVTHMLAGRPDVLAAMAKNTATDMCSFVCDQAVQIHGGYGYMRETLVERLYRDARLYPIGGGTREIMNEIISKAEGY